MYKNTIRCASKAVILHEGKVLFNRCVDTHGGTFYALPGGGQQKYETMEQCLERECLEETGYRVRPLRFLALYEDMFTNPQLKAARPELAHKIYHIFLCALQDTAQAAPLELDEHQQSCEWIALDEVARLPFYPLTIRDNLLALLEPQSYSYLGTGYYHSPELM